MRREREYMMVRDLCRENLRIPLGVRDLDYDVQMVRSGDEVLADAGLTVAEVLNDPTLLLRREAYQAESIRIDPFHAAAGPLISLRLAAGTWNEDVLEIAVAMAVDAIAEHGIPPEIADVCATDLRAEDYSDVAVIGAMFIPSAEPQPSRKEPFFSWMRRVLGPILRSPHREPTISPYHWAERADAAYTMVGARASMPADHPARSQVTQYLDTLLDPRVPDALVLLRGIQVGDLLTKWSESGRGVYE